MNDIHNNLSKIIALLKIKTYTYYNYYYDRLLLFAKNSNTKPSEIKQIRHFEFLFKFYLLKETKNKNETNCVT